MSVREHEVVTVELPPAEIELLLEILANAEKQLIIELSHTDTRDYREKLERKLNLLETLRVRFHARGV